MTINETVKKFDRLDCSIVILQTGHPDYIRGIVTKDGISLGRITFKDGVYDHIKWYWRQYGYLNSSDKLIFFWNHIQKYYEVLSDVRYDQLVIKAEQLYKEDYAAKLLWRQNNAKKNGGHRAKLTGKSVRGFLRELLHKPEEHFGKTIDEHERDEF